MTLSIKKITTKELGIMALSIMKFHIKALCIMTLSIITISIKELSMPNDIECNNNQHNGAFTIMTLSIKAKMRH
jgi:hypothetical protein